MKKFKLLVLLIIIIITAFVGILLINNKEKEMNNYGDFVEPNWVEMFNKKFEAYESETSNISNIKSLYAAVKSSNATNENHQIELVGITLEEQLNKDKNYNVKFYYDTDGYINKIEILEN